MNQINDKALFIFWLFVVIALYFVPSLYLNLKSLFVETSSEKYQENPYVRFLRLRIGPIVIIGMGISYFGLEANYGFFFKATALEYLIAVLIAVGSLILGTAFGTAFAMFFSKRWPDEFNKDIARYQKGMGGLAKQNKMVIYATALVNGFSEEIIVRVFLIGTLVLIGVPLSIAVLASLVMNYIEHLYQGRWLGPLGVVVTQVPFLVLFLVTWNYGLLAVAHSTADLLGVTLLPIVLKYQAKPRHHHHKATKNPLT